MSEYIECQAELKDLQVIKDTLSELGIPPERLKIYDQPTTLEGWHDSVRAHIVIPARIAGTQKDVGLEQVGDRYKIWLYDYDLAKGLGKAISQGRLKQLYAKNAVVKQAKKTLSGVRTKEEHLKDGRIRIRLTL